MSMPFEVSYCTRFCCAIKSGRCSVCATPVSFVSSFLPVLNFTSNAHFVFPYLMGFSFLTSSMLRSDESYGDYASNSLQASSGTSATSASVLAVVCIPRFSLCSVSRLPIYTSLIKTVAYGGGNCHVHFAFHFITSFYQPSQVLVFLLVPPSASPMAQKRAPHFRDELRFRTTYIKARKETLKAECSTVCLNVSSKGPNFSSSQSTTPAVSYWLCQKREKRFFYVLKTP